MSRHATGAGSPTKAKKAKHLPDQGRNVEGATYTIVLDRDGSKALRCRGCNAVVRVPDWWTHACRPPA